MSHIPASAMPHAKPHDEGHPDAPAPDAAAPAPTPAADADRDVAAIPSTQAPPTPASTPAPEPVAAATAEPKHDAPQGVPPAGPGKRPGPGNGVPVAGIVAAVAVVGGLLAALVLRRREPDAPEAKAKPKGGPRKNKRAD